MTLSWPFKFIFSFQFQLFKSNPVIWYLAWVLFLFTATSCGEVRIILVKCVNAWCIYSVKPTWRHGTASTSLAYVKAIYLKVESVCQNCVMGRCANLHIHILLQSCCQNFVVPSLAFDCSGNLSVSCVTSHPIWLQGCGFGLGSSLWTPLCSEFPGVANALLWPTCSLWWDLLCSKWIDIRENSTC